MGSARDSQERHFVPPPNGHSTRASAASARLRASPVPNVRGSTGAACAASIVRQSSRSAQMASRQPKSVAGSASLADRFTASWGSGGEAYKGRSLMPS